MVCRGSLYLSLIKGAAAAERHTLYLSGICPELSAEGQPIDWYVGSKKRLVTVNAVENL